MPRIYHEDLDRTVEVPPSAVHVHERSGWVLVDDDAPTEPRKRRGTKRAAKADESTEPEEA